MSDPVDPSKIEGIVGATRHPTEHIARAVSAEQTVYILHSAECLSYGFDLRGCPFSTALDRGIDVTVWVEDEPLTVAVVGGRLVPAGMPL